MVIECATQFNHALHQRIVGNEGFRPDCLNQLFLGDQTTRIFNQKLQSLVNFGAQPDLFAVFKNTAARDVQGKVAESVCWEALLQGIGSLSRGEGRPIFGFSLALFRYLSFPSPLLLHCQTRSSSNCGFLLEERQKETLQIVSKVRVTEEGELPNPVEAGPKSIDEVLA